MGEGTEAKEDQIVITRLVTEIVCELKGHTETVEFCKFDPSGKWLVTGGMNNQLRVWDVENDFALKIALESQSEDDITSVEWHPVAPLLLVGGKDYMIYLINALNGKVMGSLAGHEQEVTQASFTKHDKAKSVVSASEDTTIRVWAPVTGKCLQTIRPKGPGTFHTVPILTFDLHSDQPLVVSGDSAGKVYAS